MASRVPLSSATGIAVKDIEARKIFIVAGIDAEIQYQQEITGMEVPRPPYVPSGRRTTEEGRSDSVSDCRNHSSPDLWSSADPDYNSDDDTISDVDSRNDLPKCSNRNCRYQSEEIIPGNLLSCPVCLLVALRAGIDMGGKGSKRSAEAKAKERELQRDQASKQSATEEVMHSDSQDQTLGGAHGHPSAELGHARWSQSEIEVTMTLTELAGSSPEKSPSETPTPEASPKYDQYGCMTAVTVEYAPSIRAQAAATSKEPSSTGRALLAESNHNILHRSPQQSSLRTTPFRNSATGPQLRLSRNYRRRVILHKGSGYNDKEVKARAREFYSVGENLPELEHSDNDVPDENRPGFTRRRIERSPVDDYPIPVHDNMAIAPKENEYFRAISFRPTKQTPHEYLESRGQVMWDLEVQRLMHRHTEILQREGQGAEAVIDQPSLEQRSPAKHRDTGSGAHPRREQKRQRVSEEAKMY